MNAHMKRIIIITLLSLMAIVGSNAQNIVKLKNGSIIRGELIEYVPNEKISIKAQDGSIFVYNDDDVISITQEERDPLNTKHNANYQNKYLAPRGYRGFIEINPFNATNQGYVFNIKTTHGYQINHKFFVGGGMGMTVDYTYGHVTVPIYAAFKGNVAEGPVQFTYGVNVGAYYDPYAELDASDEFIVTDTNFYSGCNVGMRFAINPDFAINLMAEFNLYLGTSIKINYGCGLGLGLEF